MSDLHHELAPDDFVKSVYDVMRDTPMHTYQILTKRPERMAEFTRQYLQEPVLNIWLGTSIENNRWVVRADQLRQAVASTRFLSCEPLLGPLPSLNLSDIDQVIVGGESGDEGKRRPFEMSWAREIRDKAVANGVAFFFKQAGGYRSENHPYLTEEDGTCWEWHQWPDDRAEPVKVHRQGECEFGRAELSRIYTQEGLAL